MWVLTNEYLHAGSAELSTDELLRLACSRDEKVRCRIAENPHCSLDLQTLMIRDPNWEVRASLALNEMVPLSSLEILAEDPNPNVRLSLADNSRLPAGILEFLCHDDNPYVAELAKHSLERKTLSALADGHKDRSQQPLLEAQRPWHQIKRMPSC